jgi:prepilin peptidase CpaA
MSIVPIGWSLMLCAVAAAAWTDVRTRRVPNVITGGLAATALALHATQGFASAALALGVMVGVFALGCVAFSFGWFGGGDVKLLAACCGVASWPGSLSLIFFTLIAGGVVSIVEAAVRGRLRAVLLSTVRTALTNVPTERLFVPYAVAIAIGSGAYVLSMTVAPFLRFNV